MPIVSGNVGAVFNGGTITRSLAIDPTTYAPIGAALQIVGKDAVPVGNTLLQVQDNGGNDVFDVDDVGDVSIVSANGAGVGVRAQGAGVLFSLTNNAGSATMGLFGHSAAAQPTLVSGTATPEQIALALQSYGAAGGT